MASLAPAALASRFCSASNQDPLDAGVVAETLREVLDEQRIPRVPPRTPAWLSELLAFTDSFSPAWGLVGLVVAVPLVWWFLRRARAGASDVVRRARVEQERSATRLLDRARAAEDSGELADALGLYLGALVVGLSESGLVRVEPAWTLREIVERGAPPAAVKAALLELARELDPKRFGSTPIDRADVARLAARCREHLPFSRSTAEVAA